MPIAFSDLQLKQLTDTAALIPHGQRAAFLRAVAARLDGGEINNGDLMLAINAALDDLTLAIAS